VKRTTDRPGTRELAAEGALLPGELEKPVLIPDRSERAEEIVAAARRILESEGPQALTMRRVADELGIQAPSLYKHFTNKRAIETALIIAAMVEIGDATHSVLRLPDTDSRVTALLATYRAHALANAALYRLVTQASFAREQLPEGLEAWAGNPWFVVAGDASLAQAMWSFAHGMVVLEIDDRYPPGSDLESTWRAGASAFERAAWVQ
jgi:AcrR family transcriptional regulator